MKKTLSLSAAIFAGLIGLSSTSLYAQDTINDAIPANLIDQVELDGYKKYSYQVVLGSDSQWYAQPYEFRGSKVQMKLLVELFHNEHNNKKAARIITLGNGFIPGKSGVDQTYDAPLLARFTQTYPTDFEFSVHQAGGNPIFSEDYSPQNEASDVSISSTTVSPSIGLSLTLSPAEGGGITPSAGLNVTSQLGVNYTTRFSTKDYVTAVIPKAAAYQGTGVKWKTSLSQLYTNDYQYYNKWAGVYHYTDCYNTNLIPEENFPRLIYGYKPKFQYVFTPDVDVAEQTQTTLIATAKMKEVQEGFKRGACTWTDYGTKTHHTEAQVRFTIDWDALSVNVTSQEQ